MNVNFAGTAKSLLRNRLQASLTLIGMSVGIAMVVIVSGLGLGAHRNIETQLQSAGPTLITIHPGNFAPASAQKSGEDDASGGEVGQGGAATSTSEGEPSLDVDTVSPSTQEAVRHVIRKSHFHSPATPLGDAEVRTLSDMPDISAMAASMDGNVSLAQDAGTLMHVVHVNGFQPAWPDMRGWKLVAGRWISDAERHDGGAVALLPVGAAVRLWPDAATPLGQTLKFNHRNVTIVGTFTAPDIEAQAVIPQVFTDLKLARELLGRGDYDSITVRGSAVEVMSALAVRITAALRGLHRLPENTFDDFNVQTQSAAAMRGMGKQRQHRPFSAFQPVQSGPAVLRADGAQPAQGGSDLQPATCRRRYGVAAGGRYRRDEHHARIGNLQDPRDRVANRSGRPHPRRADPVPGRGHHARRGGRPAGHAARHGQPHRDEPRPPLGHRDLSGDAGAGTAKRLP